MAANFSANKDGWMDGCRLTVQITDQLYATE